MKHDDRLSTRSDAALNGQLRWYGAAAAAGLLAVAPAADAQIVYTDIPDVTLQGTGGLDAVYSVDFDNDGDPEIDMFESGAINYAAGFPETLLGADTQNGIIEFTVAGSYQYFLPLSAGAAISAGNPDFGTTAAFQFGPTFTYNNADPAGWVGAGDKFVGTRFSLNGVNHFGWVRVNMPAAGTLIVRDFAYESTPGAAIDAGDTGATTAPFTIDVNPNAVSTSSPGSFTFTFQACNNSGAAASGDVFYTAPGGFQGVILSGSLADGQCTPVLTRTQPVPAGVNAGTYAYTVRVGQFPGATVASDVIQVTISAPREAATADVAPVEWPATHGDDWAVAAPAVRYGSVNNAAVRGGAQAQAQAVVSETGANPFRGATSLALQVPTTQRVLVEVFDALGRQVAVLHDGAVQAGEAQHVTFDGSAHAAGVYVVRVTGETFSTSRTVTLLK